MTLQAIKYQNGHLEILNQLLLPQKSVYEELFSTEDGWQSIRQMKVGLSHRHHHVVELKDSIIQ